MLSYVWAILSVMLVCTSWALFQLWVAKHAPGVKPFQFCCGSCFSRCDSRDPRSYTQSN